MLTLQDIQFEMFLRARKKKQLIWKTKDGNHIPLQKISDEHLINILKKMIEFESKKQDWSIEREERRKQYIGDSCTIGELN